MDSPIINRIIYSIVGLCLGLSVVKSQPITFRKTYANLPVGLYSGVQRVNTGYVGWSDYISDTTGRSVINISKLDEAGNMVWDKSYGSVQVAYNNGFGGDFCLLPDSGFVGSGTRLYTSGSTQAVLFRLTKDGDTLFTREFGDPTGRYDLAYTCRPAHDGGYLIAGETDSKGDTLGDVYVIKTDSLGNILWEKNFGGRKRDMAFDIEVDWTTGSIYVAGQTESFTTHLGCIDPYLIKLDSLGNLLWEKIFPIWTPHYDGGSCAWIGLYSPEDIYLFATKCTQQTSFDGPAVVFKLDSAGNVQWEKEYGPLPFNAGVCLASGFSRKSNGNIVIAGSSQRFDSLAAPGLIGEMDSAGNLKYLNVYRQPGYNYQCVLTDLCHSNEGGYVAVGVAYFPYEPWAIKVDSMGCLQFPDSCGQSVLVSRFGEEQSTSQEIQVWPNPAAEGYFNLKVPYYSQASNPFPDPLGKSTPTFSLSNPSSLSIKDMERGTFNKTNNSSAPTEIGVSTESFVPKISLYSLSGQEIPIEVSEASGVWRCTYPKGISGVYGLRVQLGKAVYGQLVQIE